MIAAIFHIVGQRAPEPRGYPLPVNPESGVAWWRYHQAMCRNFVGWWNWQAGRSMDEIIPVLRWLEEGAAP